MRYIDLNREEMHLLEQGARFITVKRQADLQPPAGTSNQLYWAREFFGDKNRFRLSAVSALCLNDLCHMVMQRVD